MPAAVSMPSVVGSRVRSAAEMTPLLHLPCCSSEAAKNVAERVEEQAVSILIAGPAQFPMAGWQGLEGF